MKEKDIPILTPAKFRERYYLTDSLSKSELVYQGFYLNHTLLKSPIKTHRKMVYDFVFLTQGSCSKYKGIDKYDIQKNEFFFIPAYQISGSDFISEDA